tara:strand:+ start:391 stop:687 length:297 start_codon:yes stop_codon:yes gene_type:complete
MSEQQNHPLHQIDRDRLNHLLVQKKPEDADLIDLARLFIRYEDFPGENDLKSDLKKVLRLWGFSRESLNVRTKEIWNKGYKVGDQANNDVGSGFDTSG